jgi:RNA polymerase sigma-70 factor (ECF subfamily)
MGEERAISLKVDPDLPAAAVVPGEDCPPSMEEIYRLHSKRVARWVARLGGSRVDLEDLVQEVFVTAQQRLPSFRGEGQLKTWLYGISANIVRHDRRRQRWRRWLGLDWEREAERLPAPAPLAPEQIEKRQADRHVYEILDGLSERHRTVLILFEIEEVPGEQIANLLGIRPANLWVLLHRAREAFLKRSRKLDRDEKAGSR